jgi:hypothetical protein
MFRGFPQKFLIDILRLAGTAAAGYKLKRHFFTSCPLYLAEISWDDFTIFPVKVQPDAPFSGVPHPTLRPDGACAAGKMSSTSFTAGRSFSALQPSGKFCKNKDTPKSARRRKAHTGRRK